MSEQSFEGSVHSTQNQSLSKNNIDSVIVTESDFICTTNVTEKNSVTLTIKAPANLTQFFFENATRTLQKSIRPTGFKPQEVPIEYITENYRTTIVHHLTSLFLKTWILPVLYRKLSTGSITTVMDPKLHDVSFADPYIFTFSFVLTTVPSISIFEWKHFPFRPPKRKNYRDLDRQAKLFIETEKQNAAICESEKTIFIEPGDWVQFSISLQLDNKLLIDKDKLASFWFRVGAEESDNPLRELFLGKQRNDNFTTTNESLTGFLCSHLHQQYELIVTITDHISHRFFCIDRFKKQFRLKTLREIHQKLIEVFSYRNDLSQRRATIEEVFQLMLTRHQVSASDHLVKKKRSAVLEMVQNIPDYNVYRAQSNFEQLLNKLAKKQLLEEIFIDQFAHNERISITNSDVKNYLNLTIRPRIKEFIYFTLPGYSTIDHEMPIATDELKLYCLREKAMNHIIYHLTKQ